MQAAVEQVIAKANKGHALVSAVCYSLRYDKHHHSPALSQRCGHILQLWKSTLPPSSEIFKFSDRRGLDLRAVIAPPSHESISRVQLLFIAGPM